jgi:WD40 repeat protein
MADGIQGAMEAPRSWRLLGHADTVRALCWVEEGQPEPLLASGSLDGSARVWRPADGTGAAAVAVLEGHDGPVTALATGVDAVRRRNREH